MQKLLARTEPSNSLNSSDKSPVLCYYKNTTQKIQVARISNITNYRFERLVFPEEQLLFEAVPEAELEIHTATQIGATLFDKILCSRLQVHS
jgi:hypothetical protein